MPWYAHIAWRHLFPEGKRFPFFTAMSIVGVALGVAVLIIVISVFNGFGHEIRLRIAETYGDLRIEKRGIQYNYEQTIELLRQQPSVAEAAPYAHGVVMLQFENRPVYPAIQGVDIDAEIGVVPIGKHLITGSLDDFDGDSILVSAGVARDLRLSVGAECEIYTPLMMDRISRDEVMLPRSVRVAGVFETGWQAADESTIIASLRLMQDLYGLGDGVHGLKARLKPGYNLEKSAVELNKVLGHEFHVFTWLESNRDFLSVLQFEKRMMFFLLFIILIVSAFSIMSSLLISVIRKTREIGLFASMGAAPRQIAACFCLQGAFIGLVGTAVGFGFGFALLSVRNELTKGIMSLMGLDDGAVQFYAFSYLPVHVQASDLILIGCLSFLIATLAGLIPAYKASRLKPVEALRSE